MPLSESGTDLALVLADLRRKRERLDHAIAAIEELLAPGGSTQPGAKQHSPSPFELIDPVDSKSVQRRGRFDGLSILTATRDLLAEAKEPRTAVEIAQLLVSGGYQAKSRNFANTVAAVLNRCDKSGGDIIRVGKNLFTLVERNHALPASYRSNPNE
jgi:hypothetical protein